MLVYSVSWHCYYFWVAAAAQVLSRGGYACTLPHCGTVAWAGSHLLPADVYFLINSHNRLRTITAGLLKPCHLILASAPRQQLSSQHAIVAIWTPHQAATSSKINLIHIWSFANLVKGVSCYGVSVFSNLR